MKEKIQCSDEKKYYILIISSIAILLTGTIFYHLTENWNFIDSFYFSVMALTTVGFGDLVPSTPITKIFTSIYVIVGIGIIFNFINKLAGRKPKNKEAKK